MCLCPVTIPNPYLGGRYVRTGRNVERSSDRLRSASSTIDVPCGKCSECLSRRYTDLLQRVYIESLTSYVFMVSLTYAPRCVPTLNLSTIVSSSRRSPGRRPRCLSSILPIYYADYSHIQSLMKRLRNDPLFSDREFRYFAVSEYGSERMRPHFHLLFFVSRRDGDDPLYGSVLEALLVPLFKTYFSRNIGTRKSPVYEPYFDDVSRIVDGKEHSTFDLHLVRPRDAGGQFIDGDASSSSATVCSYLLSYVNKTSRFESYVYSNYKRLRNHLDSDIADRFRSILQCRCKYSHHLGFGFDTSTGKRIVPVLPDVQRLTLASATRSEFMLSLPDSFDSFVSCYPDLASAYSYWWDVDCLHSCWSIRYPDFCTFLLAQRSVEVYFLIALKYHPERPEMFVRYHHWSKTFSLSGTSFVSRQLSLSFVCSVSYKYLQQSVSDSIRSGSFFRVRVIDEKGPRYVPMSLYYKRYAVTDQDVLRLYDKLGVRDFDDYLRRMVYLQRPYSERLQRSARFTEDSKFLESKRFRFHRELQNFANLFAYSKKLFIFAPDVGALADSSSDGYDVQPADLSAIDRRRVKRQKRIIKFVNKMFPLYAKSV